MSDRVDVCLKDEFGRGHIRVWGAAEVMAQRMFGLPALGDRRTPSIDQMMISSRVN